MKSRCLFLIALFLFISFSGWAQATEPENSNTVEYASSVKPRAGGLKNLKVIKDALQLYVIGDWGMNGYYRQKELADMMQQAGNVVKPHLIVSTGDNFYPHGVASVQDPYLRSSFEDIYSGYNLFCDWYLVLGNHDYMGNAQAQIDYTKISRRWNMPDRYYYEDRKLKDGGSLRMIFLDTNPFHDPYYTGYFADSVAVQDTVAQKVWLEEKLAASDADWNLVFGHHPFYTSGKRIGMESYARNHLEGVFEAYEVDAYFCGHEHDLQHQKPEGKYTHYFVSGAGSEIRETGKLPITRFAESVQGFMVVSVEKTRLTVQVVDYLGNVLYQTEIEKGKALQEEGSSGAAGEGKN